ncbi:HNRNPA1_2 [Blepharisma stoltei]|uniref:RRM domain-containing protein n=1 Tax=Blepharisma stoltei TaxID=1481888 RepID=A0AAU9JIV2_9CILI|nr:unnamed protein product [Blepharisma stoltei]
MMHDLGNRKLFVGGLAPQTTREKMIEHFQRYGPVQDCILMIDRATGRSRCFGFITMHSSQSADMILVEDQIIDGKKVDCKLAVPREQNAPPPVPDNLSSQRTKKMFVGGLPPDVTEDIFRAFFQQFGPIEDSVVMFDRETGSPRGFGFITFISEDSVERVLENYEHNYINGKWIECKKATPRYNQPDERYKMQFMPYPGAMPYMMYPPQQQFYNQAYSDYPSLYDPYINQQVQNEKPADSSPSLIVQPQQNDEAKDEHMKQKLIEDLLGEAKESSKKNKIDKSRGKIFN